MPIFFVPNPKFLSTFKGFLSSAILFPHVKTFTKIKVFAYLRSLLKKNKCVLKHTYLFVVFFFA